MPPVSIYLLAYLAMYFIQGMMPPKRKLDLSFIKRALEQTAQMSAEIVDKLFSEPKVSKNIVYLTDKPLIILSKDIEFASITVRKMPIKHVREYIRWKINTFVSGIENTNIAKLLTSLLNTDVPTSSGPVELKPGDTMIIFKFLSSDIDSKILSESELIEGLDYEFLFVEVR